MCDSGSRPWNLAESLFPWPPDDSVSHPNLVIKPFLLKVSRMDSVITTKHISYLIIALVGLTTLAASFIWDQTKLYNNKNIGMKGNAFKRERGRGERAD